MRTVGCLLLMTLGVVACGGGGSGSSGSVGSTSSWTAGVYRAESTYAHQCAVPRTGNDPYTGEPYPDTQGSVLTENNFLRSWTHDLYLWYDEVTDQNPALFTTTASYFDVLKTTATTASGAPKDKFHFTYTTAQWEALSQQGTSASYGAQFDIVASMPPREVRVAYVEPINANPALANNIGRGAKILTIDGVDINDDTQTGIDTLNAGLDPSTVGESHTFSILDEGASVPRNVTLQAQDVTMTSVQNVHTVSTGTGLVGYMLFNDHLATSESELVSAFTTLANDNVTDLVLDIRYNGGGYLDIASEVAYMIAGSAQTQGKTFELTQFNAQHPTVDPVSGETITPVLFHNETQGFSTSAGLPLPSLNLSTVYVLTGSGTCSASESIINSLRGIGVTVIQIGSTTCGKPYGFYPQDNCGTTYFSIEFRGVNAQNFGDYTDGFSPQNTSSDVGTVVPGCSVADDFTHQLGDSAEGRFAAALGYRSAGQCTVPATGLGKTQNASRGHPAEGQLLRSIWRENRIFRRS